MDNLAFTSGNQLADENHSKITNVPNECPFLTVTIYDRPQSHLLASNLISTFSSFSTCIKKPNILSKENDDQHFGELSTRNHLIFYGYFYLDFHGNQIKPPFTKTSANMGDIPKFKQDNLHILNEADYMPVKWGSQVIQTEKQIPLQNYNACFNCQGLDHFYANCPFEIKRPYRSSHNFEWRRRKSPVSMSRYHESQFFINKSFKPGVISSDLRRLMNLKKNDIPPYIYLMRIHGYPPGYLHESFLQRDILAFKFEGNIQDFFPTKKKTKLMFIYPGFNAPLPDGVVDQYALFKVPKINHELFLTEQEESDVQEAENSIHIDGSAVRDREYYYEPLSLNIFSPKIFWRSPPALNHSPTLEDLTNEQMNLYYSRDDPFGDEQIPSLKLEKIVSRLRLFKPS